MQEHCLDYLWQSDKIGIDGSDTAIVGNVSYGAIYVPLERLKRGKIKDAAGLFLNGIRLYVKNKLTKEPNNGWEKENVILDDLYNVLDRYHVTREEMENATMRYVNSRLFQQRGFEKCLHKLRNFGSKKEIILFTRESSESAKALKNRYGMDRSISQITKYKPDNTINEVSFLFKTPHDRYKMFRKHIGDAGVMISDNNGDRREMEGRIGLFITKGNSGDANIKNFNELSKQLDTYKKSH
jgi:hypothetical protein